MSPHQLKLVINTHVHADHITGSGKLKQILKNQSNVDIKSVISQSSGALADIKLQDGQELNCDAIKLQTVYTPGIFVIIIKSINVLKPHLLMPYKLIC